MLGLMASRALIAAFVEENAPWLVVVTREVEERPSLVRWFQDSFTLNPIHAARFEGKEKPHEIRAVAFGCLAKAIRGQLKADGLRSEERPPSLARERERESCFYHYVAT